jgi:hypothetical protein
MTSKELASLRSVLTEWQNGVVAELLNEATTEQLKEIEESLRHSINLRESFDSDGRHWDEESEESEWLRKNGFPD